MDLELPCPRCGVRARVNRPPDILRREGANSSQVASRAAALGRGGLPIRVLTTTVSRIVMAFGRDAFETGQV